MRKVLFACFNRFDFPSVAPALPRMATLGWDVSLLAGYHDVPNPAPFPIFVPRLPRGDDPKCGLRTILDACMPQSEAGFYEPLLLELSPELGRRLSQKMQGWQHEYELFARQTIEELHPCVVVVSEGSVESHFVGGICRELGICCCSYLPSHFEHKFIEPLVPADSSRLDILRLVAGEHGRSRMVSRGIAEKKVQVTGNPRFNRVAEHSPYAETPFEGTILCAMQGTPEDRLLASALASYARLRPEATVTFRPHPEAPLERMWIENFVAETASSESSIRVDVSVSSAESLSRSAVLVSICSSVILDALAMQVPVVCWHASVIPCATPFVQAGAALRVENQDELVRALDDLAFTTTRRAEWLTATGGAYLQFLSAGGDDATARFIDTVEKHFEETRSSR